VRDGYLLTSQRRRLPRASRGENGIVKVSRVLDRVDEPARRAAAPGGREKEEAEVG
jgi:hypothetical protein